VGHLARAKVVVKHTWDVAQLLLAHAFHTTVEVTVHSCCSRANYAMNL